MNIEIIEEFLGKRDKQVRETIDGFLNKCNALHEFVHDDAPWKCSTEVDEKKLFVLKLMIESEIDSLKMVLNVLEVIKKDSNEG